MSTLCYYPAGVSEAQWEILQLLLPKPRWRPSGPGRKPLEGRRVLSGISYVNKTGCQRRLTPQGLRQWAHNLWLFQTLAPSGYLGEYEGHVILLGTPVLGTSARTVCGLYG
jgi:transposase